MITQRPISPFELSFFRSAQIGPIQTGGLPILMSSVVEGELDADILRRVLAELAAVHPMLGTEVIEGEPPRLRHVPGYRPPLTVVDGGDAEYLRLIDAEQDWRGGLFAARLLRDGDRSRIVLVLHHGIADGRSSVAVLDEMWRRYTAHAQGTALPVAAAHSLPEAIDDVLAQTISEAECADLLDRMRGLVGEPPAMLPRDGGPGAPQRFVAERIELGDTESAAFAAVAKRAGMSVNSLLSGCALVAMRSRFDTAAPLFMVCGYAADLRAALHPPLPAHTVLNCASGWGTGLPVSEIADPVDLGRRVEDDVRAALDRRDPARLALAARYIRDPRTAALVAGHPTLAISNIGRIPAHPTPAGVRVLRDDLAALGPGMPAKLTAFSYDGRLTVQVEYDTTDRSAAQMGEFRRALSEWLRRTAARAADLTAPGMRPVTASMGQHPGGAGMGR
ncbi:phthiocerol/phthiodiolone dimycocerosyl transferase family protein [Nocardia terpenica]|uniref:Phthiocerol/phthiodiolone dimycocerosyl transferase n=1 Tax=Nocardia terpenica TaxID=455432 RepID=A0A164JZ59_9NOCA|nr:hypothetical protein [Nocardia terpenica]KZM70873.1 hypothetical protein AWN90_40810 [Nocardia terpenica]NQE89829.1 hypothetical protein [Nocardia terpenica]